MTLRVTRKAILLARFGSRQVVWEIWRALRGFAEVHHSCTQARGDTPAHTSTGAHVGSGMFGRLAD